MRNLLMLLLLLCSIASSAQTAGADEEEIVRRIWKMELRELTASAIELNQEEAAKFWPIWEQYREDRKEVTNTTLALTADYVENYTRLTNEKAADITTGLLSNEQKLNKMKSRYFKKIKKNISAVKAAQFIQIEATIDNELRAALTENLPLAGGREN